MHSSCGAARKSVGDTGFDHHPYECISEVVATEMQVTNQLLLRLVLLLKYSQQLGAKYVAPGLSTKLTPLFRLTRMPRILTPAAPQHSLSDKWKEPSKAFAG